MGKNIYQMKTQIHFENEVTKVDDVNIIWLPNVFLTLFMYVHTGIINNHSF